MFGNILYGVASALKARGYPALAWTAAEEARQAAERTGSPAAAAGSATSLARNESFRPPNITLWRMSAALERRESGQAPALAPAVPLDDLPNKNRKAQYYVEIGRAHATRRHHRESLYALLRAEHTAPQHVRNMTQVRELVGHMMRTARRDLTAGELGKLAQRVGVVPA